MDSEDSGVLFLLMDKINCIWICYDFVFKTSPSVSFTDEEVDKLTDRIQNAGTEVVNAKAGSVRWLFFFNLFPFFVSSSTIKVYE